MHSLSKLGDSYNVYGHEHKHKHHKHSLRCMCFVTITYDLLSTRANRQGVNISFTVCVFFVCLYGYEFSTEDKPSSVKFCTAVHRRPGQKIPHFGELC